jgi:hypothetical protein
MREIFVRFIVVLAASLAASVAAQASSLLFTFSDAVFEDGGTVTGLFEFDSSASLFSNVDVTTTASIISTVACPADIICDGFNYTSSISEDFGWAGAWIFGLHEATGTGLSIFYDEINSAQAGNQFDLASTFLFSTVTAGAITCVGHDIDLCTTTGYSATRLYSGGTLIVSAAVPIPAAFWLFGTSLGLLGWMRRKKA